MDILFLYTDTSPEALNKGALGMITTYINELMIFYNQRTITFILFSLSIINNNINNNIK